MSALVSVIIPVYNVERYLRECIDSVLHQTYQKIEIVLVDDGSTDRSGIICDEYQRKYSVCKVYHQDNRGAAAARNVGLKTCEGNYVYFFDGDDILLPDSIQIMVDALVENDADSVIFDAAVVDENSTLMPSTYNRKLHYGVKSGQAMLEAMLERNDYHVAPWMYFYDKKFLEKNKILFAEGIMCEDELFTFLAMYHCQTMVHIGKDLIRHRRHKDSIMSKNNNSTFKIKSLITIISQLEAKKDEVSFTVLYEQYEARIAKSAVFSYNHLKRSTKIDTRGLWKDFGKMLQRNKYFHDTDLFLRYKNWWIGMGFALIKKVIGVSV